MSRKWMIILFVLTILINNAIWINWLIDAAITEKYAVLSLNELNQTLDQVFALLPEIAKSDGSETSVLEAAKRSDSSHREPTKVGSGVYAIGWILLKFDGRGKLIDVTTPNREALEDVRSDPA